MHKHHSDAEFLESILTRKIEVGAHHERIAEGKAFLEKMYPEFVTPNKYGFSVSIEPVVDGDGSYLCVSYNDAALEEQKDLFFKMPLAVKSCPVAFRKAD